MRDKTLAAIAVCGAEGAVQVLGGYWKITILRQLAEQPMRFGELSRALDGVTARMLTRQLRELEEDQLVHREVHQQVPPKVVYSLTEIGRTTTPIVQALEDWVARYVELAGDERAVLPTPSS